MRIFIAGATGAIGKPLTSKLLKNGHQVFAMTRSENRVEEMAKIGVKGFLADALDAESVQKAIRQSKPDVVIEMLTSLPKEYTPKTMKESAAINETLRIEGGAILQKAAESEDVGRYILQSSCFWYTPGSGLATEEIPFALDPSFIISKLAQTYVDQESRVLGSKRVEGVCLRFGFFYGQGTWYASDGSMAKQVKSESYPIVGKGQGVWNFIHIEDAAEAIILTLKCGVGAYNITNDTPLEQAIWLPAYAKWLQAPPPPKRSIEEELHINGSVSVFYATQLRGASNRKAKEKLGFRPRPLEWL